jgi:hypothetical protein
MRPRHILVCAGLILLAGAGTAAPTTQDVFGLAFTLHQNDTVTDTRMTITPDEPVDLPRSSEGPYRFTALDADGGTVYFMDADFRFVIASDPDGLTVREQIPITVRIPYSANITRIELSHEGTVIHTFDPAEELCPPPFDDEQYRAYCSSVSTDTGDDTTDPSSTFPVRLVGGIIGIIVLAGLAFRGYRRFARGESQQQQRSRQNNRQIQNSRDQRRRHER